MIGILWEISYECLKLGCELAGSLALIHFSSHQMMAQAFCQERMTDNNAEIIFSLLGFPSGQLISEKACLFLFIYLFYGEFLNLHINSSPHLKPQCEDT